MFLSSIQVYIFCENVWRCDIVTHYTWLSIPSFLSPKFGWVHKFLWHCVQEGKELLCGRILSQLQKQTGGDRAFAGEGFFPDKKCYPSLCSPSLCRQSLLQQEKLHLWWHTCNRRVAESECMLGVRAGEGVFPLDKIYRRISSFQPCCQSVITKNFSPFQFKIWGREHQIHHEHLCQCRPSSTSPLRRAACQVWPAPGRGVDILRPA